MATFPSSVPNPSGMQVDPQVAVSLASFGDGYSQRSAKGINNVKNIYKLTWDVLSSSDATTILNFLEARGGHEKFTWTDPDSHSISVYCGAWSYNRQSSLYSISADFEQVFDL